MLLLLREKCLCIFIITASVILSCSSQPEHDKFAGNLDPADGHTSGDEVPAPVTGSNSTGTDDIVHVVSPSVDTSSNHAEAQDGPSSQSTRKIQKAARPIGKPESVGFIPPPEEASVQEEEPVEQVAVTKEKVHSIPTLPPRFVHDSYL